MKQKYHLAMDDAERRLLIGSLNDLRSRLFTEGRYTDAVDEVLLKIIEEVQGRIHGVNGGKHNDGV